MPTKGKKITPKKPKTLPYGNETFPKTEDPGISWMLNSALECVVQIHPHLMQMKQMKLNLVPYLHTMLNLHSTTISLATITINPSQYHPPHNLEVH